MLASRDGFRAFGGRAGALRALDSRAEFVLSLDDDVELAPDGRRLASGSTDTTVLLWDLVAFQAKDDK